MKQLEAEEVLSCLPAGRTLFTYYHSPVSGTRLKRGGADGAPVSIYTDLPRRFCFEKTTALPAFLKPRRSARAGLWMHRLCL